MPGSDLLSHGEAPHYHRRWTFSLLSSEWDQVVPARYGRQAIRLRPLRRLAPARAFNLVGFDLQLQSRQAAWVLYGQAARAISIG